jgi:hypothetical protein
VTVSQSGTAFRAVGDSFHVEITAPSGEKFDVLAHPPRIPTSESDKDDAYESASQELFFFPENVKSTDVARWKHGFYSAPSPAYRPVIGELIAAPDGALLIKRLDITKRPFAQFDSTASAAWLLLNKDMKPQGNVSLPARFTPYVFNGCAIIGATFDDDGTPSVRRYKIDQDGPGGRLSCETN